MTFLKTLISVALIFSSIFVQAEPNTYIRSDGQFVAEGNEYRRGFWVPAIEGAEEVFAVNSLAAEEYEQHKKMAKWFSILSWSGIGAAIAYLALVKDPQGGTASVLFLAPTIGGLFAAASSNRHLFKAMNIVNGIPIEKAQLAFPVFRMTF